MSRGVLQGLALAGALAIGCTGPAPLGASGEAPVASRPGVPGAAEGGAQLAAGPAGGVSATPAGTARREGGAVLVAVTWPGQRLQAIPLSATAIDIALVDAASVSVATGSIVRPEASLLLEDVATGSYVLLAQARRADVQRTVAASATAPVAVVANRTATASLTLVPSKKPVLSYLYPASGPAGSQVWLYGANLAPPAGGTYSVTVDGTPVAAARLQSGNASIVITELPALGGATAAIAVTVDGIAADLAQTFTLEVPPTPPPVDHVVVSPASATLSPNSTASFTAVAYSDAANTATASGAVISWSLADKVPPDLVGAFFNPNYFLNPETGSRVVLQARGSTGSVTVRAEAGGKVATASVRVN